MIKYYVMRNSHFWIDFSNQSPQWSRHCERPRVPAERGGWAANRSRGIDPGRRVVVLGFTPMLRDRDAFDSSAGPLATLPNGTHDWSQGDMRRFCVWSRHLVFRKPGKHMGTVSGHSTSFIPNRDSESGKLHLLFDYFSLYNTQYEATAAL